VIYVICQEKDVFGISEIIDYEAAFFFRKNLEIGKINIYVVMFENEIFYKNDIT